MPETPPLLLRLPNWVGDVCMSLPALQALAASGSLAGGLGRGWAADLLAAYQLPIASLARGLPAQIRQMKELPGRYGVLLTNSFGSALAMRLGGKAPIGYRGDGRRLLLHRHLAKPSGRHEVEYFYAVASLAAERCGQRLPPLPEAAERGRLPLTAAHRQAAAAALQQANIETPYTVLCPLATGRIDGRDKIWPHWRGLSEALHQAGQRLVACPGPQEDAVCRGLVPSATVLPGLGLGAYAAVCAGAAQVIANDSGPMHLAAAVGAPVLGIFGVSDPARTAPWGGAYIGDARAWPSLAAVQERLSS